MPARFPLALLLALTASTALGEPTPPVSDFTGSAQRALLPVLNRYGPDAVNLQGLLLKSALGAGSQLEASCGIVGIDESDGRRRLSYRLDTGLVFNDPSTTEGRLHETWARILEPVLREAKHLNAEADLLAITIEVRHATFATRGELPELVESGAAPLDAFTFSLACADVAAFSQDIAAARAAAGRVTVSLAGRPMSVALKAADPTPVATARADSKEGE